MDPVEERAETWMPLRMLVLLLGCPAGVLVVVAMESALSMLT
jgi:hypothetical protein